MKFRRLQHVSSPYPADGQGEVRAFYGNLLGLQEITPPSTLAHRSLIWFSAGTDNLEIHFFPGVVDSEHPRHICLEVDDLEAARRRLEAYGYKPYDTISIPNRPRFLCRDPFGNLVEFTTLFGDYRGKEDAEA